jgi:protein-tyrosine-phosphatase
MNAMPPGEATPGGVPAHRPILALLRSIAAEARHLPERLLHRFRRRRAKRELAAAHPIRSALFICHGNICRSPFAAEVFVSLVRESMTSPPAASSAGFIGPGRQPPRGALDAASRRHHDLREHRSRLVTVPMIEAADLIVVMARDQATALRKTFVRPPGLILVLGDLDPLPVRRRTIQDPWGGDDRAFADSYERIERCVVELVHIIGAAAPTPYHDVA